MEKKITHTSGDNFNSTLSFKPLFRVWQKVIDEGREGVAELYKMLLEKIRQHPELMEPIRDLSILEKHRVLVDQIMATIFPVTLSDKDDFYAVSVPFTYNTIYSSDLFRNLFLNANGDFINVPDDNTGKKLHEEKKAGAYQIVLSKLYSLELSGHVTSVHTYSCPITGLEKYMELQLDARFIDVRPRKELPALPPICMASEFSLTELMNSTDSLSGLSLEDFEFEGIAIVYIREVTEREIINNIKNSLLTLESFSDIKTFEALQGHIQDLIGVPGVQIGITPFFQVNNRLVYSSLHNASSIFLKDVSDNEERNAVLKSLQRAFTTTPKLLVVPEITDESIFQYSFLEYIRRQNWCGAILCPLYYNNELLGILEVVTETSNKLDPKIIHKIEPAVPLFELALKKTADNLDLQIDKVIKEQFTAVQRSVEWRFTEAALNYLTKAQLEEDTKIEPIVFDHVYPLYGAIDVRNSSTERNHAIQQDMLEQLQMVSKIIRKARKKLNYPLLKEIDFKIKKYTHSVSNIVLSDDEISINQFLKHEVINLFRHLRTVVPDLADEITDYMASVTSIVDMLYHHRKNFDNSITYINNALAKFIDKEQQTAQKIFPHYFERFVTDGLDYNIYIGQSITPDISFDEFYLKNLKIWQLSTLAKAGQLTKLLEPELELPLQTTQLILAHGHPISISFRPAERKFDVDGAYNIRYEIIKKRIDKVCIKNTNERLTKPGTIAIVYTQPKECAEYMEYIEFLQSEGILTNQVEQLELEELQGVSGLKALRVGISYEEKPAEIKRAASGHEPGVATHHTQES